MSGDLQLAVLWQALRSNQTDWDRYRILADWYEEEGNSQTAKGLRWLADNQKRPYSKPNLQYRLSWYRFDGSDYGDPWSDLDDSVAKYLTVPEESKNNFFYPDFDTAILDCINALNSAGLLEG